MKYFCQIMQNPFSKKYFQILKGDIVRKNQIGEIDIHIFIQLIFQP